MAQGDGVQLDAERSHTLRGLVLELGGLAHTDMAVDELDRVLDNMLSKGIPAVISDSMKRWIHTHRQGKTKIAQILGAHMSKVASIIPECFGKYHDPKAAECQVCLDRAQCSMKCKSGGNSQGLVKIRQAYPTGVKPDVIAEVLHQKTGQLAKHLARGAKVVLIMSHNSLRLVSVEGAQPVKETITMAKGKPAPVVEDVEEDEEEVDTEALEDLDDEEETADVEEGEAEEEETPAKPAKAEKVKKPKKEPKPLNKAQQNFKDELDKRTGADKQKYSLEVAKKLKVKWNQKDDPRIDHMNRAVAIKEFLGASPAPAAVAVKKIVKK